MLRVTTVALLIACFAGCDGTTVYSDTNLVEQIVHLPSGDSVELQGTGPLLIPDVGTGLLITYYPFQPFDDTVRLHATALALFRELQPRLDSVPPPFVGLNAVDRRATERPNVGTYAMRRFGVVVERRSDGRWYALNAERPLADELSDP